MIDIRIDMKGNLADFKQLGAYGLQLRRALEYAQGQAITQMRKTAIDFLTDLYFIKGAKVRQAINTRSSGKGGRFVVRGTRLPLHNYKLSPTKPSKKPKMLRGAVKKSGGVKPLGSAFLMLTKTGKYLAVARKSRARLPIEALIAPAVPQLLEHDPKILDELIATGKAIMTESFTRKAQGMMKSGRFQTDSLESYSSSYNPM